MVGVTGGDKLGSLLQGMASKLGSAKEVEVGFLPNARYPDGTLVAAIAAIQEFGAPRAKIPPRPFFRNMVRDKSPEWPDAIRGVLKSVDYDAGKALTIVGDQIAGQLKQSIEDTFDPPLSPVTLMLRGMRTQSQFRGLPFGKMITIARERVKAGETNYGPSTKPLIDSGDLLRSIDFRVK